MRTTIDSRTVLSTVLLLGAAACGSTGGKSGGAHGTGRDESAATNASATPSPETLPWTDAFSKSTVLLAEQVRIEGPQGLISHIASISVPEELDRTEKATPEGFLQVISVKPEAHGAEIKAQLDRLAIVALDRLTILEKVGATSVVVMAKGDAYWADTQSKEEKRGDTLRFEGKIAR